MTADLRTTRPHRRQRYRRLTSADRRIARGSGIRLVGALLLLKFLRLQTTVQFLLRLLPAPSPGPFDEARQQRAQHMADIFVAVANLFPLPTTCLPRGLALWWLLRSAGFAADIVLGVRPSPNSREAHAWVEVGGLVLGDPNQIYAIYSTILMRYPKRQ